MQAGDTISGTSSVKDGDTLIVNRTKIRLFGIDAPEYSQNCKDQYGEAYPCGRNALQQLSLLLQGATVSCEPRDIDRYNRIVAVCFVDDKDIGQLMVQSGYALAYRRYSKQYVPDEREAKQAKRGMWIGRFDNPTQWRHEQ